LLARQRDGQSNETRHEHFLVKALSDVESILRCLDVDSAVARVRAVGRVRL